MPPRTVRTFQDCIDQGYTLRAYCHTCFRSAPVDLQALARAGWAHRTFIQRKWRCRMCGQLGQITMWPPAHRV
jgi:hypothetical protein